MTLIFSYQSITKSFGEDPVFEDLTINISDTERLGLIGSNGSGKSTLLKIIAGEDTPESGEKFLRKHIRLAFLPQDDDLDPEKTVGQTLFGSMTREDLSDPENYRRVQRLMGIGGFDNDSQKCGELSGGWKKRLAITRALAQNPDLLLLDEPTNHLDIQGILWLEEILKKASFAYVVVSHDRQFLDTVCTDIMELGLGYPEGFLKFKGGYTAFTQERERFIDYQLKQEDVLTNKMKRETEWLHQGAKARSTKARFRIDSAAQLYQELSKLRRRNRQTDTVDFDFDATQRKTKKLLSCKDLGAAVLDRKLFGDITLDLLPGTRLGLMGPNGSGKTTFMSILEGTLSPETGIVKRAENLSVAVFDQTRARLDPEMTLKEALSPAGDAVVFRDRSLHVASWARKFLFSPEQLTLPIRRLSGGEKARILIANLMLQPADILLLDEPTNDLDIPSLEVLEESLLDFPGAVVIVTHDRRLMERVTNRILYLDGQGNTGLFADCAQCLSSQAPAKPDKKEKTTPPRQDKPGRTGPRLTFSDKYELEHMEEKILEAESALAEFQAQTGLPEVMNSPDRLKDVCIKLQKAQETVDALYARWEELETLKNG
ncbi:MAG: ABC-F family ATP-binding cassette domain-containing protein [Pseudomonadota bacterium]